MVDWGLIWFQADHSESLKFKMEIRWPSGRKKIDTFLQIPSHTVVIVHITHLPKPVTFDIILMAARSTSFEQRCRWALELVSLKLKFLPTGVPGCHMVWGGQNIKVTNMVATITRQTYPPILVPQMCASMCFMPSPSGRGSQFVSFPIGVLGFPQGCEIPQLLTPWIQYHMVFLC